MRDEDLAQLPDSDGRCRDVADEQDRHQADQDDGQERGTKEVGGAGLHARSMLLGQCNGQAAP